MLIFVFSYSGIANYKTDTDERTKFLNVGNEKIRYIQKGKGKDILLIHGTPGSLNDWDTIIDTLAEKHRVTAFDRLGHGYSSAIDYTYHIQDNATFVEKLILKLNLKSPLVVGHSYGGSTVACLAVNSKLKDVNYIIIDSPLYSYLADFKFKLVAIPILGKVISFISSFTIAKKEIKEGVSELFYSLKKQKIEELVQERQNIWKQPKVIYSKSKESVNYQKDLESMSNNYKNINSKITIITSKELLGTYKDDCEKFHSEVKNSKLIVLDETGHYIQLEKPKEVINIITNILD